MRVTGGRVKGHNIQVPSVSDLRPSQDIVREAIFNILGDVSDTLVLDMYAGTGALGIEALSRGARFCDFVDMAPQACFIIERNLTSVGMREQTDVYCEEAEVFILKPIRQPYDLIFLDPPYSAQPRSIIRTLPKLLAENGKIIYLHSKRIQLTEKEDRKWIGERLMVIDSHKYGDTNVSFLTHKPLPKANI